MNELKLNISTWMNIRYRMMAGKKIKAQKI